jgi:hypothetical protein
LFAKSDEMRHSMRGSGGSVLVVTGKDEFGGGVGGDGCALVGAAGGLERGEDVGGVVAGDAVEVEVGGVELATEFGAFLFLPFPEVGGLKSQGTTITVLKLPSNPESSVEYPQA